MALLCDFENIAPGVRDAWYAAFEMKGTPIHFSLACYFLWSAAFSWPRPDRQGCLYQPRFSIQLTASGATGDIPPMLP
jgi:hypothetical protein